MSHAAGSPTGVLVVHGFTGNPFSVRGVADAMVTAGFDVEAPCLPGHGTVVDDLVPTRWAEWADTVAGAADELTRRCDRVVAFGQSMGGALALSLAFERPGLAGLVCVNPVTHGPDADTYEMLDEWVADGITLVPGDGGSDIADPDGFDDAYDSTPLVPLLSMLRDGIEPMTRRYGDLTVPLSLLTSRQDHVVPTTNSEHLARTYGGPVEHHWLERSYHVATRDLERALVEETAVDFVERVATGRLDGAGVRP